jgi:hypothetical protein
VSIPAAPALPLRGVRRLVRLRVGWPVVALAAALAVRLLLVWQRATPNYFPDEYLYAALGRSLGGFHAPSARGHAAHFPALLQPLLTAPAWSAGAVATGYRVVQALNAAAVTLAAVPAYLLARRLGLSVGVRVAVAALVLVVPDVLYASFVLAEPLAYPLVLAATATAVVALANPSPRRQLAFVFLAALATFARVQFAILPLCYLAAAGAIALRERAWRRVLREQRLVIVTLLLAGLALLVSGPSRVAGYYSGALQVHAHVVHIAESLGSNALILMYAAGWILVPGAALGLVLGWWRPRSRVELAFSSFAFALGAALLVEAALFGDAMMIQERYVFYVLPLAPMAFGLYASRGWPLRAAHALLALALIALSARFPLSGWAQSGVDDHSPFLLGVQQVEQSLRGSAAGAGAVAAVAALLALVAIGASYRPRRGLGVVLGLAVVTSGTFFTLAWQLDSTNSRHVLSSFLPENPSWVDAAHVGEATVLTSPGGHTTPVEEQLFWNRSLHRVVVLPLGSRPDRFYSDLARVSRDGTILVGGRPLRGPVVADDFATTIVFREARRIAGAPQFELWMPRRTAQIAALMLGRYSNGELASGGGVVLWPARSHDRLAGWLELEVRGPRSGLLRFTLGDRVVTTAAGRSRQVRVPVCKTGGLWSTKFESVVPGQGGLFGTSSAPRYRPDSAACRKTPI